MAADPQNRAWYRSSFNQDMPLFRAAWKNAAGHHEMLVRSACKRRKGEDEKSKSASAEVPRKEEGEQVLCTRALVEAPVVVAHLRNDNSSSGSGMQNEYIADVRIPRAAAAPPRVQGPGDAPPRVLGQNTFSSGPTLHFNNIATGSRKRSKFRF